MLMAFWLSDVANKNAGGACKLDERGTAGTAGEKPGVLNGSLLPVSLAHPSGKVCTKRQNFNR